MDKETMNYCGCGEYLAPGQLKCDDKKWGCGKSRPGLYCTTGHSPHVFIEPHAYVRETDYPERCTKCNRERWDLFCARIKWQSRDKAYWKSLFKALDTVYTTKAFDTHLYVLQRRYRERLPRSKRGEDPIADYGLITGTWLKTVINNMVESCGPCVDNVRFAACSSRADMRRYKKRKAGGCCGSHDEIVTHLYMRFTVGCNYGH